MTRDPRAIRFHAILTVLACVLLIGLAAVLEDANSRGTTIVVATHDQNLLANSDRRVIALNDGRVEIT